MIRLNARFKAFKINFGIKRRGYYETIFSYLEALKDMFKRKRACRYS